MCVHYMCAWCSQMPEEVIGFPGTEVRGGCKLPYVCWESLFSSPDPQVSHTGTLSGTTYFFFRGLVASSLCIQTENVKVCEEEVGSAGRRKLSKGLKFPRPGGSWEEACKLPRFPSLQGHLETTFSGCTVEEPAGTSQVQI